MESKIPLPTDNIYKFYALFGLMLLITSIVGIVWVGTSTNEKLYSLVKEYEAIPGTQEEKEKNDLAKVIEQLMVVQAESKKSSTIGLTVMAVIAALLMLYGFDRWHTKIQPKQDEYFELQLQKLRREVEGNSDSE